MFNFYAGKSPVIFLRVSDSDHMLVSARSSGVM